MIATSEIVRSAVGAPNQIARWARGAPEQIVRSMRDLPRTIARESEKAAGEVASGAGSLVDWTAQVLYEGPVVAANWSGTLWDWFVHVNRNRIVQFARDRYPEVFSELEGGDVRVFDSFLDPDPLSNTVSLLGWPLDLRSPRVPILVPDSELHLAVEPRNAIAFLGDAGGPLTLYGNSQVLGEAKGTDRWFFINGILTNRDLALRNAAKLKKMFGRDVVTIYNSTQGLVPDLVASALQKFTNINTEPVAFALIHIARALLDPGVERVVVIAHSRGTIIIGDVLDLIYSAIDARYFDRTNMNQHDLEVFQQKSYKTAQSYEVQEVMRALKGREDAIIDKLEMYMFANAASKMCYLDEDQALPHIESFANEHDIVTRLGCLARDEFHEQRLLRIDGPVYLRRGQYGHLLNAHYLEGFTGNVYAPLPPPRSLGPSVGDFVHQRVVANPCARNPAWKGGAIGPSRLMGYLGGSKARKAKGPRNAGGARPRATRGRAGGRR